MIDMHIKIKSKTTTLHIAVFITAVLLLLITASTASAATITVDDSVEADYSTIQAAVDNAGVGDVIEVAAGTYYEHVVVNRLVTLQGESNSTTIIDGSGSGNVIEVTVGGVMIDGFTIQNGSSGIYVTSINNVFSNNLITNIVGVNSGSATDGGLGCGIYLSGSTNNTLTSNTISNITGGTGGTGGEWYKGGDGGLGCGIYLSDSTNNTLTSNTISNIIGGTGGYGWCGESGGTGGGIYLSGSNYNTLTSNTISNITGGMGGDGADDTGGDGGLGSGIYLSGSTNNSLSSNAISNIIGGTGGRQFFGGRGGTGVGIYLSGSTINTLTSNTISNIIGGTGGTGFFGGRGGTGGGIYLSGSTINTLTSNTISNITGGTGGTGLEPGFDGTNGTGYSIYLYTSTLNLLFHNNLQNEDKNGYDYGSNSWDNGYPSGGNYWSDYIGIDANTDGIGDTPYNNILGSAGAQDRYPLMEPWNEDNILIPLNSGWNLISVPLNIDSWQIVDGTDPLPVCVSYIVRYNSTTLQFEMAMRDGDGWQFFGESFELEPGMGYWAWAEGPCIITFTGAEPSGFDMHLNHGWNLIGWYSTSTASLISGADPLPVCMSYIVRYNSTSLQFEMAIRDGDGWQFFGESFELEPGMGYWAWVDTKVGCDWDHE
jgi:hypothetical protein